MSVFVSSAVTGKSVAPKTAGRRRAAPPTNKPSATEGDSNLASANVPEQIVEGIPHGTSEDSRTNEGVIVNETPNTTTGYLPTPPSSSTAAPTSDAVTTVEKRPRVVESGENGEGRTAKRGRLSPLRASHEEPIRETLGNNARLPAIEHSIAHNERQGHAQHAQPPHVEHAPRGRNERAASQDNPAPVVESRRRIRRQVNPKPSRSGAPSNNETPVDIAVTSRSPIDTGVGEESEAILSNSHQDDLTPPRRKRGRKKAIATSSGAGTPQAAVDPEAVKINAAEMSMFELSHESRFGAVSEREKKMANIDWDEVHRKRKEAIARLVAGNQAVDGKTDEGNEGNGKEGSLAQGASRQAGASAAPPGSDDTPSQLAVLMAGGLRFRMVDGQIVEDEETLAIDRQAAAEANALNDEPVEEENDLTVRINRSTWTNNRRRDVADRVPVWKSKSDPWTDDETDKFYDALRMFGTDFFIISKMFPPKTRRQIKTKFTREEKIDPTRINNALMGKETKAMDIEHYAQQSGHDVSVYTKYDSYEHANEVIRESLKEKEQMYEQAMREEAENARQETIQREQRKAATETRKAGRKGRKGQMGMGTLGGGQDGN